MNPLGLEESRILLPIFSHIIVLLYLLLVTLLYRDEWLISLREQSLDIHTDTDKHSFVFDIVLNTYNSIVIVLLTKKS